MRGICGKRDGRGNEICRSANLYKGDAVKLLKLAYLIT